MPLRLVAEDGVIAPAMAMPYWAHACFDDPDDPDERAVGVAGYFRALRAELETALDEGVILVERQEVWILLRCAERPGSPLHVEVEVVLPFLHGRLQGGAADGAVLLRDVRSRHLHANNRPFRVVLFADDQRYDRDLVVAHQ